MGDMRAQPAANGNGQTENDGGDDDEEEGEQEQPLPPPGQPEQKIHADHVGADDDVPLTTRS